jgi:hypothetical protein
VLIKTAILFAALNLVYALLQPLPWLSRITLYNTLLPGRARLPFAENPNQAYSVSLQRLEGLFASHEISGTPKRSDEVRVVLLGDSAVWGWLLEPDQTLSACLNAGNYRTADGRRLRVYNLGYPVDLQSVLIPEEAVDYQPDAVWRSRWPACTAEQLAHPSCATTRSAPAPDRYHLALDASTLPGQPPLWKRR